MNNPDHVSSDHLGASESSSALLKLSGMLEMASTEPLRKQLLDQIVSARPFSLDASDVARVSTAAAQILVSAFRAAEANGLAVQIVDPSPDFLSAFEDFGLLPDVVKRVTPHA